MSARERAHAELRRMPVASAADDVLASFDDAGLRVIDQPEAAYDRTANGEPRWAGAGFWVVAHADGSVTLAAHGDGLGRHLLPEVVAAISAAHIRQGDYR